MRRVNRRTVGLVAIVALAAVALPLARAGEGLQSVEKEFRVAIEKVTPVTVICVPAGVKPANARSSSGVIVTLDGYVLTDGDAGMFAVQEGRTRTTDLSDDIEIRVADLKRGGFQIYRTRVVKRVRAIDSTLLKVLEPPPGGFRDFLPPATSDHLKVGDFTFAMGNAFGLSGEAPPTLTAGVVAALTHRAEGKPGGRLEFIYTSAAVNPGVNGGPLVDVDGQLVGTISTFLQPIPNEPYQFLGKAVPMDRIRAAYADVAEAAAVFPPVPAVRVPAPASGALEVVFNEMARRAHPAVVSLGVARKRPVSSAFPVGRGRLAQTPRYQGPISGILLDEKGWIVTSLRNLCNVSTLIHRGWQAPPPHQIENGLGDVQGIKVMFPNGKRAPAEISGYDGRLGVVLLRADLSAIEGGDPETSRIFHPLEPAPPTAFQAGRFVLALGNPFGTKQLPDPLLTVGVLSKQHAATALVPWRGQWQTDAAATDANCGGPAIDLRGRLLGMLQVWSPPQHGRNSGIGFIVPWAEIEAALPSLKRGRSRVPPWLGVSFRPDVDPPRLGQIVPGSPAAVGGLESGDQIIALDGQPVATLQDLMTHLGRLWAGDRATFRVLRGGQELDVTLELGRNPKVFGKPAAPAEAPTEEDPPSEEPPETPPGDEPGS